MNRVPEIKVGGYLIYGEKQQVDEHCLISVTLLENLRGFRNLISYLLTFAIMLQVKRTPSVLYSELMGDLTGGRLCTMTVFSGGKEMVTFRDRGAHGVIQRFFAWVIFGGGVQTYFLSWQPKGAIPTVDEAVSIARAHGKHFDSGLQTRRASRPRPGTVA